MNDAAPVGLTRPRPANNFDRISAELDSLCDEMRSCQKEVKQEVKQERKREREWKLMRLLRSVRKCESTLCNSAFNPTAFEQKYCTPYCREKYYRFLRMPMRLTHKKCKTCKRVFKWKAKSQKYCEPSCRPDQILKRAKLEAIKAKARAKAPRPKPKRVSFLSTLRRYYVYAWINENGVFYIGKGKEHRAWESHEGQKCGEMRRNSRRFDVEILYENLNEPEAVSIERRLINLVDPKGNVRKYVTLK